MMRVLLPEQTWIDYTPASFGSRSLAYIIDFLVRWLTILVAALVLFLISASLSNDAFSFLGAMRHIFSSFSVFIAVLTFCFFMIEWSYPIYFELRRAGVTPGKRALGLRVVTQEGLPITWRASVLRNTLTLVDLAPSCGFIAFVSMFLTARSQRIGDLVAGTLVIYDAEALEAREGIQSTTAPTVFLPLELYNVLQSYRVRATELSPKFKESLQLKLKALLTGAMLDSAPPSDVVACDRWLADLAYRARPLRKGEMASEVQREEWRALRAELINVDETLRDFEQDKARTDLARVQKTARAYQQICQRYAWLASFFPNSMEATQAARLVRRGRRLIYGPRLDQQRRDPMPFLERVPRSYAEVKPYCVFAAAVAISSALLTAALVALNPAVGWYFISEETAATLRSGHLWTEKVRGFSAAASSQIMTNNIAVALACFALGVAGGVGSILLLISNGALLGGIFTVLAHYSMAHTLFEFVIAHGILELSIIAVAAGCGLSLGDAILSPGALTRTKSLQKRGRALIDCLSFSALCLIPAGLTEGFISPYEEVPLSLKVLIGVTLGACYWATLLGFFSKRARPITAVQLP